MKKEIQRKMMKAVLVCGIWASLAVGSRTDAREVSKERPAPQAQMAESDNTPETLPDTAELMENIQINGPDEIFAYEEVAEFWLHKDGYLSQYENEDGYIVDSSEAYSYDMATYGKLHYRWSSDNETVAKFFGTRYGYGECAIRSYYVLDRHTEFEVYPGETMIHCEISDDAGHTVVLSKKLTVYGGSAIRSFKIDNIRISESELAADGTQIYSNEKGRYAKVDVVPMENWSVLDMSVSCNNKTKKIQSTGRFYLKKNKDIRIYVQLKNNNTGYKVTYICDIRRFKKHTIRVKKYKKGYAVVLWVNEKRPPYGYHATTLKYKKNAKNDDYYCFKSTKDLYRKLKAVWGYDTQTIQYKNGKIIYKELSDLLPIYVCKTKKDINNAIKKLLKQWR